MTYTSKAEELHLVSLALDVLQRHLAPLRPPYLAGEGSPMERREGQDSPGNKGHQGVTQGDGRIGCG